MSREWYGLGIALSSHEARWVATDSKHIEPFWDDVGRYEVWSPVWIKRQGEQEYARVVVTPQTLIHNLMEEAVSENQFWVDEITVTGPDGLAEFPEQCPTFQEAQRL